MADLEQLLHKSGPCQVVTDEDIRTLEEIKSRVGFMSKGNFLQKLNSVRPRRCTAA
jgi:hypothetical protein